MSFGIPDSRASKTMIHAVLEKQILRTHDYKVDALPLSSLEFGSLVAIIC